LLEKYLIIKSEHAKVYFFVVSIYKLFLIICNSSIFHFYWRQFVWEICCIFSWFIVLSDGDAWSFLEFKLFSEKSEMNNFKVPGASTKILERHTISCTFLLLTTKCKIFNFRSVKIIIHSLRLKYSNRFSYIAQIYIENRITG
jgi:hypothetical protein